MTDEVEGCDVDKVKTEPDDLEEEELKKDMKALEIVILSVGSDVL